MNAPLNSLQMTIMTTLDMFNFRDFTKSYTFTKKLEVCSDVDKIHLAFFCNLSTTILLEFELIDNNKNSTHEPLKFYMKKVCSFGKVPELNVLMTTNKNKTAVDEYEYIIIDKSVLKPIDSLPIVKEDQVYFYISSEIGRQILLNPRISVNDTKGVKPYLEGQGAFG